MYLNQSLWKSAYLLEFKEGNFVKEAFTFSVPPQSEEFSYPQRIHETKTFGGSVIEDYGNDTIQISLSGTTINQQLRIIYRSKFPIKYLTGEEEIFYLKEIFEKYGKYSKLTNKEVYLYSLEKNAVAATKSNTKSWRIWLQELNIKRSKDKPFAYDYTLKCLATPISKSLLNKDKYKIIKNLGKAVKSIKSITETLQNALDTFKETVSNFWQDTVISFISSVKSIISSSNELLDIFVSFATESNDLVNSLLVQTFKETSAIGEEIAKTVTLPLTVTTKLNNNCVELINTINEIKDWYKEETDSKTNKWSQAVSYYNSSDTDLKDAFKGLIGEIETQADNYVAEVKKTISEQADFPLVIPGSNGEIDSITVAHGYKEYSYKSGDTWSTIAYKFYGDSSYSTMLQLYNKDIELSEMTSGDKIYIPVMEETSSNNSDNEIYNKFGTMDVYGKDIKIKDSDFSILNGDFDLTSGSETVNQAIVNRLNTSINSRVRNVVYGIRNTTGLPVDGKNAAQSYISASIEQTILADPRVESVDSISWSGTGDDISVNVEYTTISNEKTVLKGVV